MQCGTAQLRVVSGSGGAPAGDGSCAAPVVLSGLTSTTAPVVQPSVDTCQRSNSWPQNGWGEEEDQAFSSSKDFTWLIPGDAPSDRSITLDTCAAGTNIDTVLWVYQLPAGGSATALCGSGNRQALRNVSQGWG